MPESIAFVCTLIFYDRQCDINRLRKINLETGDKNGAWNSSLVSGYTDSYYHFTRSVLALNLSK